MDLTEYKKLIELWTSKANSAGLTLSTGEPIPTVFWKTFLGISRTSHYEMMIGTYRRKDFPQGLAQTIRFADRLDRLVFLKEVKHFIPIYEANKRK